MAVFGCSKENMSKIDPVSIMLVLLFAIQY